MLKGFIILATLLGLSTLTGYSTGALAAGPAFTQEQAEKGADLYIDNCLKCHGATLSDGQVGAPLRGSLFRDKWDGKPLSELMEFMSMTMPPDKPGYFYPDEYADLMAYILQHNDFKPGDTKLPEEMAALKDVTLDW